jgi:Xaa-Pro aminopeptidase
MEVIKAGNTTLDMAQKWPQDCHFWGVEKPEYAAGYALAHGIGLSLHEYPMFGPGPGPGAKEPPKVTLQTGMCMAIETYFGDRDHDRRRFGTRLEECIAVTDDGYELFTHYPVGQIIECPI